LAILFAAGDLFSRKGFDQTSLEEIAAAAELSVPTIYSYFPSKSDLLLGLLDEDKRDMVRAVEHVLKSPPKNVIDALVSLVMTQLRCGYDPRQKSVWREILAAALRCSPDRREEFLRLLDLSAEPVERLLRALQKSDLIRPKLDIQSAARAVDAISRNCFRLYLMRERATIQDLEKLVRADVETLVVGLKQTK
jgi:AcrR family transcriptional regulator